MIENLLNALERLQNARKAHQKAKDQSELGKSYFLHDEENAVSNATAAFETALNELIDARIKALLENHLSFFGFFD